MSCDQLREDLNHLLATYEPHTLLVIDPQSTDCVDPYLRTHPDTEVTVWQEGDLLKRVRHLGKVDLALIAGSLEQMDRHVASAVIARLRDVHARRLFVVLRLGDQATHPWKAEDLVSYGMTRVGHYECDGEPVHLYGFDIDNYKITPDWLNARYWAHPELFDKYRW